MLSTLLVLTAVITCNFEVQAAQDHRVPFAVEYPVAVEAIRNPGRWSHTVRMDVMRSRSTDGALPYDLGHDAAPNMSRQKLTGPLYTRAPVS